MNNNRFHSVLLQIGFLLLFMLRSVYAGLPWEKIAEKYDQGVLLYEKAPSSTQYSVPKDFEISVGNFDYPNDIDEVVVSLQKWSAGQWSSTISASRAVADGAMPVGNLEDGFYKVQLDPSGDDPKSAEVFYFLLKSDWKKDLLDFCRQVKYLIETHPQAHDIGASIVLSHFSNLQEKVIQSEILTGDILSCLLFAVQSKEQYEWGEVPNLSVGINKFRFKRFEGSEYADFVLYVPDDYDGTSKWPLYIHVDPRRWSVGKYGQADNWNRHIFHDGMLDMWWHTTSHEDMGWKDYIVLMETLRQRLNIDENRIYLCGHCGNGIAVMALAVNYPDQWAECLFSTGNSYRHLAGNAANLSIVYDIAHPDDTEQTAYVNFAVKCFQYFGCRTFTHTSDQSTSRRQGAIIPQTIRDRSPRRVLYTIESLANPKSYWLQIDGRDDENFTASIEAVVDGQTLTVTRKNVDAYRLDLRLAPLDHTQSMTIVDNGDSIDIGPQELFIYKHKKYDEATYTKNSQLHGPISDVFTDAYTVLYTAGNDVKQTNQIAAIAKEIAGTGPCLPEGKLSDQIVQNHNLVIVGRADLCEILKEMPNELPVQFRDDKISFDGQVVTGDVGVMMIYPNPLNPGQYITFVLAASDLALRNMSGIWKTEISNADVDVAIFKVKADKQYEYIRLEKFNTIWDWHKHWSDSLATVSKDYPKWRWRQWVGHVIRTQMGADVIISEEVFETNDIPNYQSITLRILNRTLKDQWIVKTKLKGSELKTLLMQSVVKKPVINKKKPSDEAEDLIVDGVSFIKSMTGDDSIHISDIEADQYYTVAMPEELVNGSRIGMIFSDYEIVGDGYLIQILNKYLKNRESTELDSELEKMKLVIR